MARVNNYSKSSKLVVNITKLCRNSLAKISFVWRHSTKQKDDLGITIREQDEAPPAEE